jgi:hypothetical protein
MKSKTIVCAVFGMFCAVGCEGAGDSGESPSGAPQIDHPGNTETTTLATVDVGYGTVQFVKRTDSEGNTSLAFSEQASAYAVSTPLDTLLLDKPLTALEVFIAVAPDQTPPQELVDAQATQATQLGRADTSILKAKFDKDEPVQKAIAACTNWVYAAPSDRCFSWVNKLELQTTGSTWLPVGTNVNDWNHPSGTVTMGVCNATATPTSGQIAWSRDYGAWNYESWTSIAAYTVWRWFEYSQTVYGPGCSGYPICIEDVHQARYGVHQSGGPVDQLLTGEYGWNGVCNPR